MRAKVGVLLLALTPLAPVASANVYISSAACNFTFSNGDVPNFQLPEAGPNSPGDVQLNEGNPIVPSWGESESTKKHSQRLVGAFSIFTRAYILYTIYGIY